MYVEISFVGNVIILDEENLKHISLGTNNSCLRRNILARYNKKCLISSKLFYQASVTRVMLALLAFLFEEMFARASNSKGGFDDDGGNTNNARKAWHVK